MNRDLSNSAASDQIDNENKQMAQHTRFINIMDNYLSTIHFDQFWSTHEIQDTAGDGHGMISAVAMSLMSKHGIVITNDEILRRIKYESSVNKELYLYLVEDMSPLTFENEMNEYIVKKEWNISVIYFLPIILRNALDMTISIVFMGNEHFDCHNFICDKNDGIPRTVYIYTQNVHYSAIVKCAESNEGYAVDDALVNECETVCTSSINESPPEQDLLTQNQSNVTNETTTKVKIC